MKEMAHLAPFGQGLGMAVVVVESVLLGVLGLVRLARTWCLVDKQDSNLMWNSLKNGLGQEIQ